MLPNNLSINQNQQLPDVASTKSEHIQTTLNWVGMDQIDLPIALSLSPSETARVFSKVNCYVSLDDKHARGIHMSRLYRMLNGYADSFTLTPGIIHQMLSEMIDTHQEISQNAMVTMAFELPLERPALLSDNNGWKFYPAEIRCMQKNGSQITEIRLSVPYSSTCPCSASLSRQLLAERIRDHFGAAVIETDALMRWLKSDKGSVATPHSQRSWADIKISSGQSDYFPLESIINTIEQSLKTPVQTAVKREDEQEFARLNGENLMFCEDAARRIKQSLMEQDDINDFWVRVEHQESLHPHNAVAIATADLPGGYSAEPESYNR